MYKNIMLKVEHLISCTKLMSITMPDAWLRKCAPKEKLSDKNVNLDQNVSKWVLRFCFSFASTCPDAYFQTYMVTMVAIALKTVVAY